MNLEDAISSFQRGDFSFDVPKLIFRRCDGSGSDTMAGPGTVRQDADGSISVKSHVAFTDGEIIFDLFKRSMNSKSGALFAEEDYFELEAVDSSSEVWVCGKTLITPNLSLPMRAGTIGARPQMLQFTKAWANGTPTYRIHFFDQSPRDWRALVGGPYEIEMGSYRFSLTVEVERENQVKVTASSDQPFPDAFERRLVEGLQFVVGQTLHCAIIDQVSPTSRTVELYGAVSHIKRVHPYPPLAVNAPQYTGEVLKLLSCFLTYLTSLPDEGMCSPPTSFLALLRGASERSLDGWMIGLCVAVEGLAGLIDYEPKALSGELAKVQAGVLKWMDTENVSEGSQDRIKGLLGQLKSVRPKDRMMSLVSTGTLRENDIKAWTKERNRAVHTQKATKEDLERVKMQRSFDQLHCIYRLLYSIIFHVIGYVGPHTDYAQIGFPVVSFPPSTPEVAN